MKKQILTLAMVGSVVVLWQLRMLETAVLALRKIAGIHRQTFIGQTGFDPMELFAEPIRKYTNLCLIDADDQGLRLRRAALPIADSILCDFADM